MKIFNNSLRLKSTIYFCESKCNGERMFAQGNFEKNNLYCFHFKLYPYLYLMKKIICTFVFLLMAAGIFAQADSAVVVLNVQEFHDQIDQEKAILIDVRTPEEFSEGAIKGAKNINFKADNFLKQFSKIDKNQPVYIYCRSGNRSGQAAKMLSEAGFQKIYDLKGGFLAWEKSQVK